MIKLEWKWRRAIITFLSKNWLLWHVIWTVSEKTFIWYSSKIHLHVIIPVKEPQCQSGRQNGLTIINVTTNNPPPPTPSSLHPPKKIIKLSQVIYYLKFIQFLSWNKCLINVLKTEQLLVTKNKNKKNGYHQRSHFAKNF